MLPIIEDQHLDNLCLLADGILHETTADVIAEYLHPDFPKDKIDDYLASYSRASSVPEFKDAAKKVLNEGTVLSIRSFIFLNGALNSRILAPALTNSLTLIKDMDLQQRSDLLRSWRDSPFEWKQRLFRVFSSFTIASYGKLISHFSDLHNKAIGYPGSEPRDKLWEDHVVDTFRYSFLEKPKHEGHELYLPNIDVLIIGSGSGSGVVAETLSQAGYKSLILEKGKYFSNSELTMTDYEGFANLYESCGSVPTTNQQMFILAGSTFGGGSTVNWSACLRTPFKVRKEWYDDYGLEWAASQTYDDCLNYAFEKMGASTANITHSFANKTVLEGASKLGYAARPIDQNTGGNPNHSCGFCHLGCRFGIKQGSVNCWFRQASETGSKFMEQVKVIRILHSKGKAIGVLCKDVETGIEFKITGPKKFVVAGGSLNTPIVLQKSGFKNRHIGANLKLHPVSVVLGDFGNELDDAPHKESIMTSVCTEVDDLDGKAHGAKIETILHTPFIQAVFLPWNSSDETRKNFLKYKQLVSLLLIDRDTSSGSVTYDKEKPDAMVVDYSVNKFDRNALLQALLVGADILYIQGAKEIISPQAWVPTFKSNRAKEARTIEDKDYVEWRNKVAKIPFGFYGSPYGSAHQMSSCRMSGKGSRYGACDANGRLFECKNIYIADASAMPTASGANPMITTMAIARHVSLGIVKELQPQAKL